MSVKSILRVVRRSFPAARPTRADEADLFDIVITLPNGVGHHQHPTVKRTAQAKEPCFGGRVRQVRPVQRVGIREHCGRDIERDVVLLRVGGGLPRIPLEHLLSIYGIRHAGGRRTGRPSLMAHARPRKRRPAPKRVLALPDLEQAKAAVLGSLTSISGQRTYDHAIREFVSWYCSEPRLAFNRTVVLRYRIHLEQQHYAPATINLRLAAVRRVAYEAADAGLLSPELAAGIRRVKGLRRIGVRLGNWLTPEQGRRLVTGTTPVTLRERRDQAMLAMLIGCGLRRGELLALQLESIQQREEHWVIADLLGKAGHVRTVPMPGWVKAAIPEDLARQLNSAGRSWRREKEGFVASRDARSASRDH